jgi:hypothetical protein
MLALLEAQHILHVSRIRVKCQQHDTIGAQSCMCELTVAVTTSREEKHKALRPNDV